MATTAADSARESGTVRAVVVDDEPSGREAVTTLLAEHPSVHVVGEASNGKEAVQLVKLEDFGWKPGRFWAERSFPGLYDELR